MKLPRVHRVVALVYAAALAVAAGQLLIDALLSGNPRVAVLYTSCAWGCAVGCAANVVWALGYRYTASPSAPGGDAEPAPPEPREYWCVLCETHVAVVRCRLHGWCLCMGCARTHEHRSAYSCQYDVMPAEPVGAYGEKS